MDFFWKFQNIFSKENKFSEIIFALNPNIFVIACIIAAYKINIFCNFFFYVIVFLKEIVKKLIYTLKNNTFFQIFHYITKYFANYL